MLFYPEGLYDQVSESYGLNERDKMWILDFRQKSQKRMTDKDLPKPNFTLLLPGSLCILGPKVYHQAINLKVLTSIIKIDSWYQQKFNYRLIHFHCLKIMWHHWYLGDLN